MKELLKPSVRQVPSLSGRPEVGRRPKKLCELGHALCCAVEIVRARAAVNHRPLTGFNSLEAVWVRQHEGSGFLHFL